MSGANHGSVNCLPYLSVQSNDHPQPETLKVFSILHSKITDDEEDMGMLYTVIINNIRVPFLFDHEIRKIY